MHVTKRAFIFFIFNCEVAIDCSASPSFFFKSQAFSLFPFTHTESHALKLSEVDKYLRDVPFLLSRAGMLQSHNNMEMESSGE